MIYSSITAIGSLTVNAATGDTLLLDPARCSGMDDAPFRTRLESNAGADGGYVFPLLTDPRIITLGGLLRIATSPYATALATLEAAVKAQLAAMVTSSATIVWPSNTLAVVYYSPYLSTFESGAKYCVFGLTDATLLS